jgi:hypothetical protein
MPLVVLWLSALVFAVFGVLFYFDPAGWGAKVDLGATTPTARTEIRAMYGGFELGVAAFLAWCALDPSRVRIGLVAALCMFAGVALGRGTSLLTDPGSRSVMYTVIGSEIVAAALVIVALRMHR